MINPMNKITKADIVQRLLDNDSITAEEAVVLLTTNNEIQQMPALPFTVFPWYDWKSNPIFNPTMVISKNKDNE